MNELAIVRGEVVVEARITGQPGAIRMRAVVRRPGQADQGLFTGAAAELGH